MAAKYPSVAFLSVYTSFKRNKTNDNTPWVHVTTGLMRIDA
jgi:hypothetical protein